MIISIFLVICLHRRNIRTQLLTQMPRMLLPLAAVILIDKTDLYAFNSGLETAEEFMQKVQAMLDIWHHTLGFTGGNLKLLKCYWAL